MKTKQKGRHEEVIMKMCAIARTKRKEHGWSLQHVADAAEVHRNTVWRFEMGADVSLMAWLKICEALEIDPGQLIGRNGKQRA